jgi:hypothetical protein
MEFEGTFGIFWDVCLSSSNPYDNFYTLEFSIKSGDQGARTASFGIIGHQTRNWD